MKFKLSQAGRLVEVGSVHAADPRKAMQQLLKERKFKGRSWKLEVDGMVASFDEEDVGLLSGVVDKTDGGADDVGTAAQMVESDRLAKELKAKAEMEKLLTDAKLKRMKVGPNQVTLRKPCITCDSKGMVKQAGSGALVFPCPDCNAPEVVPHRKTMPAGSLKCPMCRDTGRVQRNDKYGAPSYVECPMCPLGHAISVSSCGRCNTVWPANQSQKCPKCNSMRYMSMADVVQALIVNGAVSSTRSNGKARALTNYLMNAMRGCHQRVTTVQRDGMTSTVKIHYIDHGGDERFIVFSELELRSV